MDDRRERGIRLLDAITVCINEHPIVGQWIVEILDRKTELSDSEKPNNCETCRHYTLACDLFSEICRYEPKDESQIRCPKCGRSDYIRSFEDWGIDGGIYKYKCINCNTYIKDEPQIKCDTCKTYWNCQGQCDEMPQIEDEPQKDNIKAIKDLQEYYGIKQEPTLSEIMNEEGW